MTEIRTLAELFLVAARHDKPDCLLHKVDGRYVPISTRELVDRVRSPGQGAARRSASGPATGWR